VQLAHHFGAEVTGVCSSANADLVRSLGAARVLDYQREPLGSAGRGFDLIFDTVGATDFAACKGSLTPRGTYLPLENGPRELLQALAGRLGGGKRVRVGISQNTRQRLQTLLELIERGALRPVIDRVYPMAQILDAHRHVESRHKRGSVILAMRGAS
jgi:NADPH:quinone reductase-like Zn-dependent oxidoreductase